PTSGLDPNQQQEVRNLIQTLKQKKTVLLSTHILSEARSACDRVLIIHRGKIVAAGTPESLEQKTTQGSRLRVELKAPVEAAEQALGQLGGVDRVVLQKTYDSCAVFVLESSSGSDVREAVFELAVKQHWPILGMAQETLSLEDVFRQLTTGTPS